MTKALMKQAGSINGRQPYSWEKAIFNSSVPLATGPGIIPKGRTVAASSASILQLCTTYVMYTWIQAPCLSPCGHACSSISPLAREKEPLGRAASVANPKGPQPATAQLYHTLHALEKMEAVRL